MVCGADGGDGGRIVSRVSCIDVQFVSLLDSVKAGVSGSRWRRYIADTTSHQRDVPIAKSKSQFLMRYELIPRRRVLSGRPPRPLISRTLTNTRTHQQALKRPTPLLSSLPTHLSRRSPARLILSVKLVTES